MELQNSVPESQSSDQGQPIQETDGGDGVSEMVGVPADVIGASGGDIGVEAELGNGDGGADLVKKKRGRPPRVQAKSPPIKIIKEEDEDVCFICFDGGSLVLCDSRGCPKAYHPACVKRNEAFFQSKAKWNCGWHICSFCQKAAHHMCYTCTYSLCKGCIKKADYVCVRGDKGFCIVCLKTIMLIENEGQEKDEKAQVDFDDKTSWEYLFKVYWVYLKRKLSLTLDELTEAKNPWKLNSTTTSVSPSKCVHNESTNLKSITSTTTSVSPSTCVDNGSHDLKSITSDMSPQNPEASENKRRKTEEHISIPQKEIVITKKLGTDKSSSMVACKNWATKELLDFVAHMKKGDRSMLSQYDVQELMLEYIKINNLRDPRKKSQIICDSRLKILFGKPRVGHFEMLKLLEFHFSIKEDLPKNTVTSISRQVDPDWNINNMVTVGKDKKRRNHKKAEERAPQNKLDEYAAINVHNMNLVYLRRKLMENFIENKEEFDKKVVGSIVRIRISGKDQKHDMYRLVQVVGTRKADATYKIGDKSADVVLEVLNLDKKETISVDTISNQDLSEDECRRLRQSIRCGLVKRFTVGEIQDKAVSLQSVRLNELMEAETLRLNNLRDRASEKGHKKSLREYVEKLQLLKTPEERVRRLREIPEVHSDPKMNPDYETDDTEEYFNKAHEPTKMKYSGISRKNTISLKKQADFSNSVGSRKWKKNEDSSKALGRINIKKDAHRLSNGSTIINFNHKTTGSSSLVNTASETVTTSNSMKNIPLPNYSDIDKVWHYRDPIGKVQGPFCMVQLQKWSTTGYFPQDMRIWTHKENESLLLNDVLNEQLHKTSTDKVGVRIEGLTVQTANLSSIQNSVNHVKLSDSRGSTGQSQSSVHNWFVNGNKLNHNKSNVSNMPDMASPTPAGNNADIKNVSSEFNIANADLVDLPSPTPKKTIHEVAKVQTAVDKEQDVGVAQLPKTADEWSGYSPTQVKHKKTAHEDEMVQNAVDKEQDAGGGLLPKTADEWNGYSPTQVKKTTHEVTKVQTAVDKEQDAGGALLPKTDDEWSGYSPTQVKETPIHEVVKVQTAVDKEQDVGGAQLPKTADEWNGYSPTQVKREELHSEGDRVATTTTNIEQVIRSSTQAKREEWHSEDDHVVTSTANIEQVIPPSTQAKQEEWHSEGDHVATTNTNIEQIIPSSSQPAFNNYLPPWEGVRETIEFSTLAEESVSDLLAEVDAMESQNGFPSPTSSRNNFVEDLFNGTFEDFSPTPQGARGGPFSSNGAEIDLSFQPTTTTTTTTTIAGTSQGNNSNEFDFVKSSTDLQFKWPEIPQETTSKYTNDVNNSTEAEVEADEGERETKTGCVQVEEKAAQMCSDYIASEVSNDRAGGSIEHKEGECTKPETTKSKDPSPELLLQMSQSMEPKGRTDHIEAAGSPPSPPSLTIGLDKVYPRQSNMNNFGRPAQEITTRVNPHSNTAAVNLAWDPQQRTFVGERYNNNGPRERSYKVEDSGYSRNGKPWVRQSSFGSAGGGFPPTPPKGQRVCKFYESGRCKKGASCNYWHP